MRPEEFGLEPNNYTTVTMRPKVWVAVQHRQKCEPIKQCFLKMDAMQLASGFCM